MENCSRTFLAVCELLTVRNQGKQLGKRRGREGPGGRPRPLLWEPAVPHRWGGQGHADGAGNGSLIASSLIFFGSLFLMRHNHKLNIQKAAWPFKVQKPIEAIGPRKLGGRTGVSVS